MSFYLQVDTRSEMPQVASNAGWGDFIRWVGSLPAGEFPTLRQLCREGWTGKGPALKEELSTALREHAPAETVQTTAEGMRGLLGDAEVVSVTDGLGSD